MHIEENTIHNFDENIISTKNRYKEKNVNLTIIIQSTSSLESLARSNISRLSNLPLETSSPDLAKARERIKDVIKIIYINNTKRRSKLIACRNQNVVKNSK